MRDGDKIWLPTRQAARRVGKTIRTIRRWRQLGMPVRFVDGRMHIEEETLLLWWRQQTMRNACTKWRIRAAQRAV